MRYPGGKGGAGVYQTIKEAVLSDLVCACHARKGNVSCPLIASLQGKKEPRSADAV